MRRVTCPLCGYDQRGVIASWTDSCPLEGTCSECGHVFQWESLLSTRSRIEMQLFDRATHLRGYSFVYTLFLIPRPWRLWRIAPAPRFALLKTIAVSLTGFVFWATAVSTITQIFAVLLYPLVHLFWDTDDFPDEWVYAAAWTYGVWDEGSLLSGLSWGILAGLVFLTVATLSMPLLSWLSSRVVLGLRAVSRITLLTLAGFPLALLPGTLLGIVHEAGWDIYWDIEASGSLYAEALYDSLGMYEFVRSALDTVALSFWVSVCWLFALRRGYGVREVLSQVALLSLAAITLLFLGVLAFIYAEYMI